MRLSIFTLCLFMAVTSFGQVTEISTSNPSSWIDLDGSDFQNSSDFFESIRQSSFEPSSMTWSAVDVLSDQIGWQHEKFQQHYYGLPVLGHIYILHSKDGILAKGNGVLNTEINLPTQPLISEFEAIQAATEHIGAEEYIWEKKAPFFGKSIHKPLPKLVVMDALYPRASGQYVLAYEIDIYATRPHLREKVLVNAWTGTVINSISKMYSCGDKGTAETLYHGEREIETTLALGQYTLKDETRGGGVFTTTIDSVDFTDDDNFWEEGSLPQRNGALDAHFGVSATYDYFKERFQRNGLDGNDSPILAYIYTDADVNNAFWNGEAVVFGDGDSTTYGPFTAIDVCSHEVTHGVTEFTAGLEYQYESGALNESMSDIFGKALEMAYDSANFSWELGEKMQRAPGAGFRNMESPHDYQNPAYYKGQFWVAAGFDNGGVHFNSGVMNHWFYLLCTGKTGTNEGGLDYDVPQIGMDKAVQIAYRMLANYLTPTSQYADARQGSLEATKDLYGGVCTDEYRAVAEAWMAVGVGHRVLENDLSIISYGTNLIVCEGAELEVTLRLFNNGCTTTYPEGTVIDMAYDVDGGTPVEEMFTLTEALQPGAHVDYTFSTTSALGTFGQYMINASINFTGDTDTLNNQITFRADQTNKLDFDANLLQARIGNGPCSSGDSSNLTIIYTHEGCTIIPGGDSLTVSVSGDNYQFQDVLILARDLYPGGFSFQNLSIPQVPFGNTDLDVAISYQLDPELSNNLVMTTAVSLRSNGVGYREGFDDIMFDSSSLALNIADNNRPFRAFYGVQEAFGEDALVVTGGEPRIVRPNSDWEFFRALNNDRQLNTNLCYNSDGWSQPQLVFDLLQKTSTFDYTTINVDPNFANTVRLTFEGEGIDEPLQAEIRDSQDDFVPITYNFDLPIDIGTVYITLEALALKGAIDMNGDISLDDQDLIIIDNIKIVETTATTDLKDNGIVIYPNPAKTRIRVQLGQDVDSHIQSVKAIAADGRKIELNKTFSSYDIESLAKGSYWIVATLQNGEQFWHPMIKM